MAINPPVSHTVISTAAWGIPITDEVNRLSAWQAANSKVSQGRIAHAIVTASQNGLGTSYVDITGLAVTFNVLAGRYYQVTVSGVIAYANSVGTVDMCIADVNNNVLVKGLAIAVSTGFVAVATLITPPLSLPVGSYTAKVRMLITAGTVNTSQGTGQVSFIMAEDIGPQ